MNMQFRLKASVLVLSSVFMQASFAADSAPVTVNGSANPTIEVTQAEIVPHADILKSVTEVLKDYAGKVNVTVVEDVVHLKGQLPSDTDYERVVTMTESVKGVSDVNVDELTVKDSKSPLKDTYLTAKVKGALIQADIMGKDLPSWTVSVETNNGVVFLSGTVENNDVKENVLKITKSVKGVTTVQDKIVIQPVDEDDADEADEKDAEDNNDN